MTEEERLKLNAYADNELIEVWAEEPGVQVRVRRRDDGLMAIEILVDGARVMSATLGRWRWARLASHGNVLVSEGKGNENDNRTR